MSGRWNDQSSRRADSVVGPSGSPPAAESGRGGFDRIRAAARDLHHRRQRAAREIIWGADNIFKSYLIEKGDVDRIWQQADHIVEGEYTTGAQEQLYIENNGVIAAFDRAAGNHGVGFAAVSLLCTQSADGFCGLPAEQSSRGADGDRRGIRRQGRVSLDDRRARGASGDEIGPAGEDHLRPHGRYGGDDQATSIAHASPHRGQQDGKILGGEIDFTIDGGAYATLSSVVLSRGTIHAGGPYYWPSVRIRAKAVATNAPPHGAFRGFGAPQVLFAMERHMDRIAQVVGLSPDEIRRRNFLKPGQTTTTEQIGEEIDLDKLLDRGLGAFATITPKKPDSRRKIRRASRKESASQLSCTERASPARASDILVRWSEWRECADGSVRVLVSSTEFGQGTKTVLCQIAAEALGLPYEDVGLPSRTRTKCRTADPRWHRVRRWSWASWCNPQHSESSRR